MRRILTAGKKNRGKKTEESNEVVDNLANCVTPAMAVRKCECCRTQIT